MATAYAQRSESAGKLQPLITLGSALGSTDLVGVGTKVRFAGPGSDPTCFPQAGQKAVPDGRMLSQYGQKVSFLGFTGLVLFPQNGQNAGEPSNPFPQCGHKLSGSGLRGTDLTMPMLGDAAALLVNPMIRRTIPITREIIPATIQTVPGSTFPLLNKAFSCASTLLFR